MYSYNYTWVCMLTKVEGLLTAGPSFPGGPELPGLPGRPYRKYTLIVH